MKNSPYLCSVKLKRREIERREERGVRNEIERREE